MNIWSTCFRFSFYSTKILINKKKIVTTKKQKKTKNKENFYDYLISNNITKKYFPFKFH